MGVAIVLNHCDGRCGQIYNKRKGDRFLLKVWKYGRVSTKHFLYSTFGIV